MDSFSRSFGFESFLIMAGNDIRTDTYQSMTACHVTEHGTKVRQELLSP